MVTSSRRTAARAATSASRQRIGSYTDLLAGTRERAAELGAGGAGAGTRSGGGAQPARSRARIRSYADLAESLSSRESRGT